MDNLIARTGEDKVKRFLRTLTNQEKIELIEEVKRMVDMKTMDLDRDEKKRITVEYDLTDGY